MTVSGFLRSRWRSFYTKNQKRRTPPCPRNYLIKAIQKIRQYENRNKIINQKLAIEKRKERNHRLCARGGYMESITPELIDMTDDEAKAFLYLILTSDPTQEFLRKRAEERTGKNTITE